MRGVVVFDFLLLSKTLTNVTSPSAFSAIVAFGACGFGNRNERFRNAWMP